MTTSASQGESTEKAADDNRGGARKRLDFRLLSPRAVAIIGASSKPGSTARTIIDNLTRNGFTGDIHLVGRTAGDIAGRRILPEIADLPAGIDLGILALPAAAVHDALIELGAHGIPAALSFASGFAEAGDQGRRLQAELGAIARSAGVRLFGPNCVGFYNYVDAVQVAMVNVGSQPPMRRDRGPGIAIIAQSGSTGPHVAGSLGQRGVPVSYSITTGNEADLQAADFVDLLAVDEWTGGIVVYAEQIRDPQRFLAAVARARAAQKHVVVLHPGRSEAGREAAQSHTGALTGEHPLIRTVLESAGVAVVDTIEDLIDLSQLLLRYPNPPAGGIGLITGSGSLCTVAQDYCADLRAPLPALSSESEASLKQVLPDYLVPRNPLDVGTGIVVRPDMLRDGMAVFTADPAIGSVVVSFPVMHRELSNEVLDRFLEFHEKPAIFVVQTEDRPFWDDFQERAHAAGAIVLRSPERALRALATLERIASAWRRSRADLPIDTSGPLPDGALAEWQAKQLISEAGIPVPEGRLATTDDDAVRIAAQIGYPVVAKVQSAALHHKTEFGAVALGIQDEADLRQRLVGLRQNVAAADPTLNVDGILVEKMAAQGVELVVGAKRDPQWGPVVLVGLGGIWVEVLADVRLLPPDLAPRAIVQELRALRGAALLDGVRGAPPVDLDAVAELVTAVGALMARHEELLEVDLNPVIASADGAVALDALLVTKR